MPRRRPVLVCNDAASNGDRCQRELHDSFEIHRAGVHCWGARDPITPEWVRRLKETAYAR